LKHIIQLMQATLACVIMVAMVFSVPVLATAFPLHVGVSFSGWKQLHPPQQIPDSKLPT
jgi:hypothetical protein